MIKKDLLILERSSSSLDLKNENGIYVLEGIFGELDRKNKNNRIYTAEEYLPQIESLQDKIKSSKLLGELDHPSNFDVSLKNVSHVIEEITYDKENKQIKGRIRLLDTDAGRQAKALVDAGVPLQISSRAAGAVEENGTVKIKQLFTYDLVADPGFANAELTRVNESYGFGNDSDILIYEIGASASQINETKIENKETETMAESKFITVEDFNKYSKYLSEEIKSIKESLTEASEKGNETELAEIKEYTSYLAEKLDQSIKYAEHIAEKTDQNIQYTEHVAEKTDQVIQYSEHIAEKTDQVIQYSEHVAEKTDQSIQYAESLAEKVDQSIQYSEHIAGGVDKIKEYTNYLAESYNEGATTHESLLEYVGYLKENLEKVSDYAEYVAETVNSNLIVEDEAGIPAEDIKTDTTDVTKPIVDAEGNVIDGEVENVEGDLELDGEGEAEGEVVAEDRSEDIEDETKELGEPKKLQESEESEEEEAYEDEEEVTEDRAKDIEDEIKELGEPKDGKLAAKNEEVDSLDAYKNSITEKLQSLINKAEENKTKDPHFFKFVSESARTEFNELATEDKTKVLSAIEGRGFLTEGQILGLWQNSLLNAVVATDPKVVTLMPTEYKDTYAKLSEAKKGSILAQSKYHVLETAYQVANFWQTRDLRDTTVVMEKVEMVKESKKVEVKSTIGYDTKDIEAQIANRFKK